MILFLDDSPERAAIAYQRMLPKEREKVIWCSTAEEAICTLRDYREVLTLVTLDHDLEGRTYVHPGSDKCGMEVVRYLEDFAKKNEEEFETFKSIEFIVHSYNEYAAPEMTKKLRDIGIKKVEWIPFGT